MRKLLLIIFAAIVAMAGCSRDGDGPQKGPDKPEDTIHTDTAHADTTRADTTRSDTTRSDTTNVDTTRVDTVRTDTTRVDTTVRQVDSLVGRKFYVDNISYKVKSSDIVHVEWLYKIPGENTLTIPPTVSWKGRTFRVTAIEFRNLGSGLPPVQYIDYSAYCNSNLVLPEGVDSIINLSPVSEIEDLWLPRTFKFLGHKAFNIMDIVNEGVLLDSVRIHIPSIKVWLAISVTPPEYDFDLTPPWGNHRLCIGNGQPATSIEIPAGVSRIGAFAFAGNVSVRSIRVSDGVTSIGRAAFSSCHRLMSVVLPAGLEELNEYLFCGCRWLSKVTMPRNLKIIRKSAFLGCEELKSITLPASVKTIGDHAFLECFKLKDVYILSKTPPHIGDNVFIHKIDLHVPRESVDLYKADKKWAKEAKTILSIEEAQQNSVGKSPQKR